MAGMAEPEGQPRERRRKGGRETEVARLRRALERAVAREWEAAAASFAAAPRAREGFPLLVAVAHLLGGRRREAIEVLSVALRRDPTDSRIAHTLLLACVHTLEAQPPGREEPAASVAERAIAAWGILRHRGEFWRRWLADRLERYRQDASAPALASRRREVTRRFGELLEGVLRRCDAARLPRLLRRELVAAEKLAAVGGLPLGDGAATFVCGPLALRLLGLEERFGGFVAALPSRRRSADRVLRLLRALAGGGASDGERPVVSPEDATSLRRLYSSLGEAETLLAERSPREALAALGKAPCPGCRRSRDGAPSFPAPGTLPAVCRRDCAELDRRNPGYAALPARQRRLAEDALELAVAAHLALGEEQVSRREPAVAEAVASWREALRLAAVAGRRERIRQRIAELALGRAEGLGRVRRLDGAIDLLRAVRELDRSGLVSGKLAALLNRRGVGAGRERPPRWEPAVADLREAVSLNRHASRPLVNLSRALRNWAGEIYRHHPDRAIEQLLAALRELRRGRVHLAGHRAVERQLRRARSQARRLLGRRVEELARAGGFEQALRGLEAGLAELPDDPVLGAHLRRTLLAYGERLIEEGQVARATEVLRRTARAGALKDAPGPGSAERKEPGR